MIEKLQNVFLLVPEVEVNSDLNFSDKSLDDTEYPGTGQSKSLAEGSLKLKSRVVLLFQK